MILNENKHIAAFTGYICFQGGISDITKPKYCINVNPKLTGWTPNVPCTLFLLCVCVLCVFFRWEPEATRCRTACCGSSASVNSKCSVWLFSEVGWCLRGSSRENVLNSFTVGCRHLGRQPVASELTGAREVKDNPEGYLFVHFVPQIMNISFLIWSENWASTLAKDGAEDP